MTPPPTKKLKPRHAAKERNILERDADGRLVAVVNSRTGLRKKLLRDASGNVISTEEPVDRTAEIRLRETTQEVTTLRATLNEQREQTAAALEAAAAAIEATAAEQQAAQHRAAAALAALGTPAPTPEPTPEPWSGEYSAEELRRGAKLFGVKLPVRIIRTKSLHTNGGIKADAVHKWFPNEGHYISIDEDKSRAEADRLLRHELAHCSQAEKASREGWSFDREYRANPETFEAEARRAETAADAHDLRIAL